MSDPEPLSPRRRVWRYGRPVVLLAVAFIAARIIIGIVGQVDWPAVWAAIGLVPIASAALLFVVLLVRQVFNAVPLTQFVPALSLPQSVQNDLSAYLIGTVAPPPADVVLRVSMFRSWGIDPVEGMAGVTLNMLTFYAVRFVAPALGLAFLAFHEVESGQIWQAALSLLVAVAILGALASISRGDRMAALIGATAGRVAARFRESVNPDQWAQAVVDFRAKIGDRVRTGVFPSLGALIGMLGAESLLVLIAVRSVGLGAEVLPASLIVGTFLLAYPLTLFPLMGLGILDAVVVAALTSHAGIAYESQIVAGMIIWRVASLLVPYVLAVAAFGWWRLSTADEPRGSTDSASDYSTSASPEEN